MELPQTGRCLCGGFRYTVTAAPIVTYACHCTDCQRHTGSAFSMAIVVVAEAFQTAGAEPRPVQRRADSGRTATRWFCPECGTWVGSGAKPGSAPPGALVWERGGTLDDTSWLRPDVHFWTRSAQPWVVLPGGTARFETQPEDDVAWWRARGAPPP